MKPISPLIKPLILLIACSIVGVMSWQGELTFVMGFPWIFGAICLVVGLLSLRRQTKVALAARAAIVVLGPGLAFAGGYAQDRLVRHRLDETQRVVTAALVGKQATALSGIEPVNVDADTLNQASSFSSKATIVSFWSRRCSPCLQELPELNKLYQAHKNAGLEVVAITSYDQELSDAGRAAELTKITRLVAKLELSFPVAVAVGRDLHKAYMVRAEPSTALIDEKGQIVAYGVGYVGGTEVMEQALALLGE